MTITIKLLTSNDRHVFNYIADDLFDDELVPSAIEAFLADALHHIVGAIADDVMIGFVSAVHYVHPDKPAPELWINEVSVSESYRRQGIAQRMLKTMFEHARELGCRWAWVLTEDDNVAAIKLYTSIQRSEAESKIVMVNFEL